MPFSYKGKKKKRLFTIYHCIHVVGHLPAAPSLSHALFSVTHKYCVLHAVTKRLHLSIGGKEILLKDIAQAIPVYAMSVFLIPKGICKRMMDAISSF
jgi:hypothetical protein